MLFLNSIFPGIFFQRRIQKFLCSKLLLSGNDVLNNGPVRKIRGGRLPPAGAGQELKPGPGISVMKSEELLKQLEEERRRLWKNSPKQNQDASKDIPVKKREIVPKVKNKSLQRKTSDDTIVTDDNKVSTI